MLEVKFLENKMSALEITQKPNSFLEFDSSDVINTKFQQEEVPDILPVLNPASYIEKHYQKELDSIRLPINANLHKKPVGKVQFASMCVIPKDILVLPFIINYLISQYEGQGWNVSVVEIEKNNCFVLRFPQGK